MPRKTHGKPKTVRFTQVVERAGEPRPHTLWVPPDKDAELKRAIAAHRVMMVQQGGANGTADFGVVGFNAEDARGAQVLIFPKSLKRFEGARVVGIKFDLVAQPAMKLARSAPAQAAPRPPRPKSREKRAAPTPVHDNVIPITPAKSKPAKPKRAAKPKRDTQPPIEPAPTEPASLEQEVRVALKELEAGQAVAAYKRLQRAIE